MFAYTKIAGVTGAAYAVTDAKLGAIGRIDKFIKKGGRGIPDRVGWKAIGADGFVAHEGSNCAPTRLLASQVLREHAELRTQYPHMQLLLFVEFSPKRDGMVARRAVPTPIPVGDHQIRRVWTLPRFQDRAAPPALPYHPAHITNAFLEDRLHDWNIDSKGMFRYASRAIDTPVWVLVELR